MNSLLQTMQAALGGGSMRPGETRWIWRLPLVGPRAHTAYRNLRAAQERFVARRLLTRVAHPSAPGLARVVDRLYSDAGDIGDPLVAAIERERAGLLLRSEPLADGSLGPARASDADASVAAACRASKSPKAARLLYLLVREFRPERAIELGTNLGISSATLAAGQRTNGSGRLLTLEASPYRLRLAVQIHARLGLDAIEYRQGLFADTLDDALDAFGPIDFAFIDGHHKRAPTLDYFERIWRHASSDAIFVFDDIRWSEGMRRAWATLRADARITFALDLYSIGVCVAAREPGTERRQLGPFRFAFIDRD